MALIQKHAVTPSHPSIRKWRHRAQSSCMKKNTTVLLLLDFIQLNTLAEKYGEDLIILGFPCNQFGHQCYEKDFELLNTLKYVRPGDGYAPKFQLMTKSVVNGDEQEALWTFLKDSIPYPCDDRGGTGSDFIYKTQPNDKPIQWSPVRRNDVSWNFEKFLIDKEGVPFKRYSPKFENKDIVPDIDSLLNK
ncbi:glutathione peroxidase [Bathycoccus prasinos]|uniref:Glutathione peroxidase n=1 Tax=Bathycoccus prasinos TaxID=41875 RepID=K8FCS5_9CHLO|nr:glutathione peroxidase [Bathycoccus prasinos]CCO19803.1 glutathione peroxidase [Bathycoccus prasinos]|eukprot:XP_007509346.1 glutathione peroxidase [Bathycoccus prasinos]